MLALLREQKGQSRLVILQVFFLGRALSPPDCIDASDELSSLEEPVATVQFSMPPAVDTLKAEFVALPLTSLRADSSLTVGVLCEHIHMKAFSIVEAQCLLSLLDSVSGSSKVSPYLEKLVLDADKKKKGTLCPLTLSFDYRLSRKCSIK